MAGTCFTFNRKSGLFHGMMNDDSGCHQVKIIWVGIYLINFHCRKRQIYIGNLSRFGFEENKLFEKSVYDVVKP